jgi:single-strand DNA-binding protein
MNVNKVIVVGHLGRDPEIKHLPSGTALATMSVATTEKWKDKVSGERKEETEWHRVVVFGRSADYVGQFAKKGSLVYVLGKLKTRKWQDAEGNDKYSTEVVVDFRGEVTVYNANPKQSQPEGRYIQSPAVTQAASEANSVFNPGGPKTPKYDDDDIPF